MNDLGLKLVHLIHHDKVMLSLSRFSRILDKVLIGSITYSESEDSSIIIIVGTTILNAANHLIWRTDTSIS